jgi:parvulin-like peptidyl-prolyl isomerase
VTVSEIEARAEALPFITTTTLKVARYWEHNFKTGLTIPEADIAAYYEQHKSGSLMLPELRSVLVAYTDRGDNLAAEPEVTADEIKAWYEANKAKQYPDKQVHASHILFRLPADATDEVREAKRKLAEEVLAKARGGGDFAALAKQYSEDAASRDKGGDFGFFSVNSRQWAPQALALKDGEVGPELVKTVFGYHIVKKHAERDGFRALQEVEGEVRQRLLSAKWEERFGPEIKADYAANPDKYTKTEAKVRHIVIKRTPFDAREVALNKQQRAKAVLDRLKAGEDFVKLAAEFSEDYWLDAKGQKAGSAVNGGLVGEDGWISEYTALDPNFRFAALALKDNETSELVEGFFGFHIIQRVESRTRLLPLETIMPAEVERRKQAQKQQAAEAASRAAAELHAAILASETFKAAQGADKLAAFRKLAEEFGTKNNVKVHLLDSKPFAQDTSVPDLPGNSSALVKAVFELTPAAPLTKAPIAGDAYSYVACLAEVTPAREPALDAATNAKIRTELMQERGTAIARERARKDAEALAKALAAGTPFADASKEMPFESVAPFTLANGPTEGDRITDLRLDSIKEEIVDLASSTAVGKCSAALDVQGGAVVIYVVNHLVDLKDYALTRQMVAGAVTNQMRNTVASGLYDRLSKETDAVLSPSWQAILAEPEVAPKPQAPAPDAAPAPESATPTAN